MSFEWDEAKRLKVLIDRGIDFERAKEIWQGHVLEIRSRHAAGEERWLAVGEVDGTFITVVFTWRGDTRRLITARRARRHEAEAYQTRVGRGAGGPH
jgi:uncharacterized DUF497 family protein